MTTVMLYNATYVNYIYVMFPGGIPAATISDFDDAKRGRTRPGQSQRRRSGRMNSVWKCLVFPGVGATAVFFDPKSALIVDDLPTFGKPMRPTVGTWPAILHAWSDAAAASASAVLSWNT